MSEPTQRWVVCRRRKKMNERRIFVILVGLLISVFLGCVAGWRADDKTPRMTKEELRPLLGNPGVVVVDVRVAAAWKKSERKIQGATYEDPESDITKWANKYPRDKTLVFYCS